MTPITVAVLAFEAQRWNHAGAKTQAVLDLFGVSRIRYDQAANAVLDDPDAMVLDGLLVNRLRRLRETRRRARAA